MNSENLLHGMLLDPVNVKQIKGMYFIKSDLKRVCKQDVTPS